MAQGEQWTIGRLLEWTTAYLGQHGSETPRLDAEVLLAHARGCPRIELYTAFQEPAEDTLRDEFRQLVRQRAAGTPVAYLVGEREFYSLPFQVTPAVLIPRPETEFVVMALLDLVRSSGAVDRPLRLLDVGTGSGILAICAAVHLPNSQVTALDISPAALEVAQANAERHGVADRVTFQQSDLFQALPESARYDFILSNPPYIGYREKDSLPVEVRDHEPPEALFAGEDGMEVITRLVQQAPAHLNPGGWLLCEIGPVIEPAVRQLLTQQPLFHRVQVLPDLAKLPRVLTTQKNDL